MSGASASLPKKNREGHARIYSDFMPDLRRQDSSIQESVAPRKEEKKKKVAETGGGRSQTRPTQQKPKKKTDKSKCVAS
ncbi:MAG: hypothetical protein M1818_003518 [Claussenomyces sp. TS43310]|nr:MAG: hypothetical protein M1818_003518 [Claussenomyces sp. TS43310]